MTRILWLGLASLLGGCGTLVGEDFAGYDRVPPTAGGAGGSSGASGAAGGSALCDSAMPLRQATVRIRNLSDGKECAGSLLTNGWVLTANHCVAYGTTAPGLEVARGTESAAVAAIVRHPSSEGGIQQVDLALLQLASPMSVAGSSQGHRLTIWPGDSGYLYKEGLLCIGHGKQADRPGQQGSCHDSLVTITGVQIEQQGVALDPVTQQTTTFSTGDQLTWKQGVVPPSSLQGGGCYYKNPKSSSAIHHLAAVFLAEGSSEESGHVVSVSSRGVREWIDRTLMSAAIAVPGTTAAAPSLASKPGGGLYLAWHELTPDLELKLWIKEYKGAWEENTQSIDKPLGNVTFTPGRVALVDGVSDELDRLDLAVRGNDGHTYQNFRVSGEWQNWFRIDTSDDAVSPDHPTATAWGPWTRLDLFSSSPDMRVRHAFYEGDWATPPLDLLPASVPPRPTNKRWSVISPPMASAPTAVSWGHGRLDVFAVETKEKRLTWAHYKSFWHPGDDKKISWSLLPMTQSLCYPVAAVAEREKRIDLFTRGCNNTLWHAYYDEFWTKQWLDTGIPIESDPAVASSEPGRIDVVWSGSDSIKWMYTPG